ncbi:putative ABC transporter ATP-binding protein YxlF [Adhaeretor mobilis]|uniref:Putative ABC transporter ATP-binding protein YxlF n=2 Tax=Adhaeretor mobilis TaxID=1930276 RepID=A0A517MWX4_9BACT|nr:putative ABC transporter ATP-binding protein YxlF [Adhaeretor mobilis]
MTSNPPNRPLIEVRGLHRYFGKTKAVQDMSFKVFPGEVFGYIGPNGAGKTTSMRILATLDEPTYGNAFVDGFSVVDDPDRVRRRLGFMPDYFGAYQNVNVYEYLDFFARSYGLRGAQRTGAIHYVMDFTQLDKLADKPIDGLSKGMKQRLCLGRTMIHDPAVLILDEPAAGLDPRARIELREMIALLAKNGKAVLISSHILTELAEICDRVGIIEQGKLLAVGSVDEISGRAETISKVQVRVLDGTERLITWLTARDDIADIVQKDRGVAFTHEGGPPKQAELLKQLVQAEFAVVDFASKTKSLEDVFLHVTEGRVQ